METSDTCLNKVCATFHLQMWKNVFRHGRRHVDIQQQINVLVTIESAVVRDRRTLVRMTKHNRTSAKVKSAPPLGKKVQNKKSGDW